MKLSYIEEVWKLLDTLFKKKFNADSMQKAIEEAYFQAWIFYLSNLGIDPAFLNLFWAKHLKIGKSPLALSRGMLNVFYKYCQNLIRINDGIRIGVALEILELIESLKSLSVLIINPCSFNGKDSGMLDLGKFYQELIDKSLITTSDVELKEVEIAETIQQFSRTHIWFL